MSTPGRAKPIAQHLLKNSTTGSSAHCRLKRKFVTHSFEFDYPSKFRNFISYCTMYMYSYKAIDNYTKTFPKVPLSG
jgi:hypothetical protein